MGLGDDLMITSFARKIKEKNPNNQIVIGNNSTKEIYDSVIYKNNPFITHSSKIDKSKPILIIDYHNFNRPYIDYKNSLKDRIIWNNHFKPTPGEIYFTDEEEKLGEEIFLNAIDYWKRKNLNKYKGIIFFEIFSSKINTPLKIRHQNLDWGYENWIKLINNLKNDYLLIQSLHDESSEIEGVYASKNKFNFREACSILKRCDLFLGNHGGFDHAAAALNKKAVVYFGGWINPKTIGYPFHKNIYVDLDESPCGAKGYICEHCNKCRKSITTEDMSKAIFSQLS